MAFARGRESRVLLVLGRVAALQQQCAQADAFVGEVLAVASDAGRSLSSATSLSSAVASFRRGRIMKRLREVLASSFSHNVT